MHMASRCAHMGENHRGTRKHLHDEKWQSQHQVMDRKLSTSKSQEDRDSPLPQRGTCTSHHLILVITSYMTTPSEKMSTFSLYGSFE